jgi:NAD-dependent deacetylase
MVDPILGPVVVLTGAGISAESDVPTFRGKGVVWRNFRSQELATPEAFCRDPATVWEAYDWRRGLVGLCVPNAAHETLVEMKREQDQFNWEKEEGT